MKNALWTAARTDTYGAKRAKKHILVHIRRKKYADASLFWV